MATNNEFSRSHDQIMNEIIWLEKRKWAGMGNNELNWSDLKVENCFLTVNCCIPLFSGKDFLLISDF